MDLIKITEYIKPDKILNANDEIVNISGISYNSKTVEKGDIFVCLVGEHSDGHIFAAEAVKKGASAVVAQKDIDIKDVPVLIVKDTQFVLAQISCVFYNFPSEKLRLIGITGTNGKTTVTHLVEKMFENAGIKCGLIGTLGQRFSSDEGYKEAKHTTPQSPELQQTFSRMLENDIKNVVMEVSSHALEQHRVGCTKFAAAVLTNLTQDHLDYHITMENYFKAKSKLFSSIASQADENNYTVINADDPSAEKFISSVQSGIKILTYGINKEADIMAKNIDFTVNGANFDCKTPIGEVKINLQMTGMFSIYNALAALAVGIGENISLDICIKALETTKSVAGRFEVVEREPLIIVDYAHTPDGLSNVLEAAGKIVPVNGKLICVFGCGGDRDATKRPKMGKIAEDLADIVIITSDNPRSEDPQQIITDILTGIRSLNAQKISVEIDRRSAIEQAIRISNNNDVIVIAGKGHEDYQILKDKTIHFDDREEARLAFEKVKN